MAQQKKKSKSKTKGTASGNGKTAAAGRRTTKSSPDSRPKAASGRRTSEQKSAEPAGKNGYEAALLAAAAFCILLLLANLDLAGSLGRSLKRIQLGSFGTMGYIFPVLLFWVICLVVVNGKKRPGAAALKAGAWLLVYASACGLLELIGNQAAGLELTMADYYRLGGETLNGGWTGGLFMTSIYPVMGVVGTYVILAAIFIVGVVLATGRSVLEPLSERGSRYIEDAREERNLRREAEALRREEEQLRREERRQALMERRSSLEEEKERFHRGDFLTVGEDDTEIRDTAPEKKERPARHVTAEEINAGEEKLPGKPTGKLKARKVSRTLEELDALDRGLENQKEKRTESLRLPDPEPVEVSPAEPAFEPVIHMGMREFREEEPERTEKTRTAENHHTTAKPHATDNPRRTDALHRTENLRAADKPAVKEKADALRAEKTELPWAEKTESLQADNAFEKQPVPERMEEETPEDSMAGYDEFPAGPVPSAWELELGPGKTKTQGKEKTSGKGETKKPLQEESIWRTGKAADGTSGVTFTSPLPPVHPAPEEQVPKKEYQMPPLELLTQGERSIRTSAETLRATAAKLQQTLRDFGVGVTVTDISCGPTVTRYELQPDQGVKVSRIVSLQNDIKLYLAATEIRIEAPIPGKSAVGIEVPNEVSETVYLREVLESQEFRKSASRISFGVGKDIAGAVVVSDLARMPHVLIAGATGTGKSVCINTIIMSILFKARPDEVKLIMIDPKVVELSVYNGIPHLMIPVVTDPKKAAGALQWAVAEMTDRYKRFADLGVRDIKGYNQKIKAMEDEGEEPLPQIVVIVDEMADLMMAAKNEVEDAICRLAQLARAAGIHLVLATQRPSVDVITGLIKANVPSRIALATSSGVDSRTILDMTGAEKLLGKGDMLFYPSNFPKPQRVQGAFVTDEEVQAVVDFLTPQATAPASHKALEQRMEETSKDAGTVGAGERDELFEKAGRFIIEKDKASIGNLQRVFRIGFNRAARIMDQLADYGVVGEDEGTKAREILMTMEAFEELLRQLNG